MTKVQVEVTKLYKILQERSMLQKDLFDLIEQSHNGKKVPMYILNGIISGKRQNYTVKTAKMIAKSLNLSINDVVD